MPGSASKDKAREDSSNTTTWSSPSERDMPESGSSNAPEDDWANETDPNKRRRIQNRIAQRKFRERTKQEREDRRREEENKERASYAYTSPTLKDVESPDRKSGVPWGGFNVAYGWGQSNSWGGGSGQSPFSNTGQGRGYGSR